MTLDLTAHLKLATEAKERKFGDCSPPPLQAVGDLADAVIKLVAEVKRARGALRDIARHRACSYENTEGGQYGIGVTDGHRLCSAIAKKGLGE